MGVLRQGVPTIRVLLLWLNCCSVFSSFRLCVMHHVVEVLAESCFATIRHPELSGRMTATMSGGVISTLLPHFSSVKSSTLTGRMVPEKRQNNRFKGIF